VRSLSSHYSFVCKSAGSFDGKISIWAIANKVKWDCLFWGIGTAFGELPPYFVARASLEAGKEDDEFSSIERIMAKDLSERSFNEKVQIWLHDLLKSAGFWGILLCASIPNPLFDLAGIICGRFGISFSTFFSATLIGKAFIKTNIQVWYLIYFSVYWLLQYFPNRC
jgi:hypothetical protein